MQLRLSLLKKFIELPNIAINELRQVFDDLGLEVKDLTTDSSGDYLFNIETLANRGDHLHVLGIAREFSARYLTSIKLPDVAAELSDRKTSIPVKKIADQCLRYALLELQLPKNFTLTKTVQNFVAGVKEVSSTKSNQEKSLSADPKQKDQSATTENEPNENKLGIVQVLNYVQTELGQPMHAFDQTKVEGEIQIRVSDRAEEILALDGKTYKVPPESLLICDRNKIIAVAGVIGCANSMVTTETERVLVESALFDPVFVRKTARKMGLSTDASYLFERGADPEMPVFALRRVLWLLSGAGGATDSEQVAHAVAYTYVAGPELNKRQIELSLANIKAEMQLAKLELIEVSTRLKNLGYLVQPGDKKDHLLVTVPSWRYWSVTSAAAVLEDFVRAYGINRSKLVLPCLEANWPASATDRVLLDQLEKALLGNGFVEVISKSYYSKEAAGLLEDLNPKAALQHIAIKNALDSSYSHMKISNVLHLAEIINKNLRYGQPTCKVYEFARLFSKEQEKDPEYDYEQQTLTMAFAGRWQNTEWQKPESLLELSQHFKAVIEIIFAALACNPEIKESNQPYLHPGQQARVTVGRTNCGFFGVLHPKIKKTLDLSHEIFYAEFSVPALISVMQPVSMQAAVDFPFVKRDLTLKVPRNTLANKICKHITAAKVDYLKRISITDCFEKPEEDFRRVTYRLVFQSAERTLEHAEVDLQMGRVLNALEEKSIRVVG